MHINPLTIPYINPLTISVAALTGCAVLALVSGTLRLREAVLIRRFRHQLGRIEAEAAAWHNSAAEANGPDPPVLGRRDELVRDDKEPSSVFPLRRRRLGTRHSPIASSSQGTS